MTRAALLVEQNWNAVPGGTARSTNDLIDALREHTSVLVTGVTGSHGREPVLSLPEGLVTSRVPVPGRVLTECWSRFGHPSLDRWVEADIVHAPAYVIPPTERPLVVTIHDLAFVRHPEWFTSNGVRFFRRFLDTIRRSDASVIVPSDTTADDCAAVGIEERRITVIPWGIDATPVEPSAVEDTRRRHELPERFVLYVGTLEPRKNLSTLAEAMALLSDDIPLVVVGPDGWGDVTVPGGVMLGEVPGREVPALMAAATVLAYPSHFEGFGLPVLEAMAQGTPVVTTIGTAPAEIADDAGLAVDTRDPTLLANTIRSLVDDSTTCDAMGDLGRQRAATYRWSDTAKRTAAVYESIQ